MIAACFVLNLVALGLFLKHRDGRWWPDVAAREARSRVQEQMEMADFCDFLALSLEAGNNLGVAFLSAHMVLTSAVGVAFARGVKSQLACGVSVSAALQRAATRENYEVATELSSALNLATSVGSGLAFAARKYAQDLRSRASSTLEERAARMPVLMLFPLAIFILPVVCVLLTAGAVAEFLRTLL